MAFEELIEELKQHVSKLKKSNVESQTKIQDLLKKIQMLEEENEMLKKKLASDTRFKQFVEIKRECNTLRDVTGNIAQQLQNYENKRPLPTVKRSGKINANSKAYGPGARPMSAILSRPKSARNILIKHGLNQDNLSRNNNELANLADFEDDSRPSTAHVIRPKSGRSQFRSPTVASCHDDAEMYVLDPEPLTSRPSSVLRNTLSARYAQRPSSSLHMHRKLNKEDTDRTDVIVSTDLSRPSSVLPQEKSNVEKKSNDCIPVEIINDQDNLCMSKSQSGVSIDELEKDVNEVKHKIHCTPESSEVGSDLENFSFEDLDDEAFS